jgi:hypothetical protein
MLKIQKAKLELGADISGENDGEFYLFCKCVIKFVLIYVF